MSSIVADNLRSNLFAHVLCDPRFIRPPKGVGRRREYPSLSHILNCFYVPEKISELYPEPHFINGRAIDYISKPTQQNTKKIR